MVVLAVVCGDGGSNRIKNCNKTYKGEKPKRETGERSERRKGSISIDRKKE